MHPYASRCIRMLSSASVTHPYAPTFSHTLPLRSNVITQDTFLRKCQKVNTCEYRQLRSVPSNQSESSPIYKKRQNINNSKRIRFDLKQNSYYFACCCCGANVPPYARSTIHVPSDTLRTRKWSPIPTLLSSTNN